MAELTPARAESKSPSAFDGLYVFPPDVNEPRLLGSKCRGCELVMWPKQSLCARCFGADTFELPLSTTGIVWSSTIVHRAPAEYTGSVPYVLGIVELPEGVGIRSIFVECSTDQPPPIGTKMELLFQDSGKTPDGERQVSHVFRPLRSDS